MRRYCLRSRQQVAISPRSCPDEYDEIRKALTVGAQKSVIQLFSFITYGLHK